MKLSRSHLLGTAVVALLGFPLAGGTALAQQTDEAASQEQSAQEQSGQEQTGQQQSGTTGQNGTQSSTATGQSSEGLQPNSVVATVGGTEIRGSDVLGLIGLLPPQIQSQPPQMLVPMALEQLILRELILEQARGQNLAEDPDVVALVERSTQASENDAMVQIWLDREMANVVTDEAVQAAYDEAQAAGQQDLPPLEQVRPQIEEFLRQQAMQQIRTQLRQGADVVLYSPTGQPMEQQGGSGDDSGDASGTSEATEGSAEDQSNEDASGGSDDAADQSTDN